MGEETTNIMDERMDNKFSISFKRRPDGLERQAKDFGSFVGGGGEKCEKSKETPPPPSVTNT